MATPSERLYAQIRSAVASTPAPAVRTRARIIIALAIVPVLTTLVVLIASGLVYGRPAAGLDVDVTSSAAALTILVLLIGLALASTLFASWQGRSGFGISAAWLVSIAALVVPVYTALTVVQPLHSGAPDEVAEIGVAISPWGSRCILVASAVGGGTMAILAAALRRAVAVASGLRGAALGAAAGAWAGLAVFAFCPSGETPHLLLGHVLPIVFFTLLGAVALSRALRP